MDRIKQTIPDRPVGKDAQRVLEREVLPVMKQLRDGMNSMAPAGAVVIEGDNCYADVLFDQAEPDDDFLVLLTVGETTGSPALSSVRARVTRQDLYGFRAELQYRPGTGNTVTVNWSIRR